MSSIEKFPCLFCGVLFTARKNLYAHQRKFHDEGPVVDKENVVAFICEVCGKPYSAKSSLDRHRSLSHGLSKEIDKPRQSRLKCPQQNCCQLFKNFKLLRQHLGEGHNMEIKNEIFTFSSLSEFEEWKREFERKSSANYTLDSGEKKLQDGTKKKYYFCHRSYSYTPKGKDIRLMKSQGSNKINAACPSTMEVHYTENSVKVYVCTTHCGHTMDIGRIYLDKEFRASIAGKLSEGVTMDKILDEIRDQVMNENNFSRVHLTEKKDLHNIIRDFNIGYSTKRHQDDALSVELWVQELMKMKDSPILYYKNQNTAHDVLEETDFILVMQNQFQASMMLQFGTDKICIDGTHGTNEYNIQLYTIVAIDEFGNGCPVSYCLSNRADVTIFQIYFDCIRKAIGKIDADTFMSDDAPAFYNAWKIVMGEVPHRIICTWHVDKNWRENLNKKLKNLQKRVMVYKTLKALQYCASEKDFTENMEEFITLLLQDEETKCFGEYFQTYYSKRPETWAICFRLHIGLNTNMYLESLHKVLKYIYLDGKKVRRLDKTLDALVRLTRDYFFKRLIKISKKARTQKTEKVCKSHKKAQCFTLKDFQILGENKWQVNSGDKSYEITKIKESCLINCLKCEACKVCVCSFECSCLDSMINANICKHIHACCSLFFSEETSNSVNVEVMDNKNDEIMQLISVHENDFHDFSRKNTKIIEKCELVINLCNKVDVKDEEEKAIMRKMDSVIDMLNKKQVNLKIENPVSSTTAKVDKQVRLFSKKKKAVKSNNLKNPTLAQKNVILEGLKNKNAEVLNIIEDDGFEHLY